MKKNKQVLIAGIYKKFVDESFYELEQLCKTLGWNVFDKIFQKRRTPDARFYFGKGLLLKIKELIEKGEIDYLVIDDDITNIQRRNIETILYKKVYDRTEVILEIFSKHAKTKEGRIQVEIARLRYLMPYLVGKGKELSRLGGGIGTRGPGEKKLEYEKRYLKRRISTLQNKLKMIKRNRDIQRKKRLNSNLLKISIVGYTNAGKTTLLSKLSKQNLYSKDEMFTTLAPTSRKVMLPSGKFAVFSDTVGFIRKMHPLIIEAFLSTLEEIIYSDLALVVVDVSDVSFREKIKVIYETLEKIGVNLGRTKLVFNKIDLCNSNYLKNLENEFKDAIFISAKKKVNFDYLLNEIDKVRLKEVSIKK
ncbi:GTP-binding protein [Thermosipho melanesiensis]|uniref:GTPase HflX n=2 Tax=Thermosipho melanesiensis TaxID=46541 RepID=A6LNU7_THEM4|nr:GTPase HflX [Thermosipho melanesiensis]ABR31598.1 small GTP-binding protein [Thermosipho melanesiensis BI429]APT74629.1 GTP-binding protein [Thermosipho melanesiensis]OOC35334.1 GTP-binding protein [Thermosipho melanesiensis]OOC35567.1 GTP-binding protein [Thermosipho melanesiensis]OOC36817.1 GTP-binding protein [Thermosipho melanesiensis]